MASSSASAFVFRSASGTRGVGKAALPVILACTLRSMASTPGGNKVERRKAMFAFMVLGPWIR